MSVIVVYIYIHIFGRFSSLSVFLLGWMSEHFNELPWWPLAPSNLCEPLWYCWWTTHPGKETWEDECFHTLLPRYFQYHLVQDFVHEHLKMGEFTNGEINLFFFGWIQYQRSPPQLLTVSGQGSDSEWMKFPPPPKLSRLSPEASDPTWRPLAFSKTSRPAKLWRTTFELFLRWFA